MRAGLILVAAGSMAAAASQAEEHRIGMAGMAYAPAIVEAKVGDVLLFVNDDTEAHNAFVPTVGFATDLGKQDPGSEARLALMKPGVFDVECVIHPGMHARVVATP